MRAVAGLSGDTQVRSDSEGESKFKSGVATDETLVLLLVVGKTSRLFETAQRVR
jgi:hypothetical protein